MIPHTKPSKELCKQYANKHPIKPEKKIFLYLQPPNTYTPALFKIASWVGYLSCEALSAIPMKHYNTSKHNTCFVLFSTESITLHTAAEFSNAVMRATLIV